MNVSVSSTVGRSSQLDPDSADTEGMRAVATRGRLRLRPIEGSIDPSVFDVEVDLARSDAALTVGDLRAAAEQAEAHSRHEVAHRLWSAMARAVRSLDDDELSERARSRAGASLAAAGEAASETFRSSAVRFDYLKIAADRASGSTAAEAALANGCSLRTVARAVEFVDERARLLARHPSFADQLVADSNPEVLAAFYGIDVNIMRWILAVRVDRRGSRS